MKCLVADYILLMDDDFTILRDAALVFDTHIIDVGDAKAMQEKYIDAEITTLPKHSVVMPGLINTHVHLEFCANKTSLEYGSFMGWLKSVITHRDDLLETAPKCIDASIQSMAKSGTVGFGAISSFGLDLEACVQSPLKVTFFNETLGSRPDSVDILYQDFLARYQHSKKYKSGEN